MSYGDIIDELDDIFTTDTDGGDATGLEIVFAVLNIFIIEIDLCIDFSDTKCHGNLKICSDNTSQTISELIIKSGTVTMNTVHLVFGFFLVVDRSKTVAVFC